MLDIPSHATRDATLNAMQLLGQPGQSDHPFLKSPITVHHEQIEGSSPKTELKPVSDIPSNAKTTLVLLQPTGKVERAEV